MTQKLYIETVGCQMNVLDSELVVGSLRRQGYELTHEAAEADVIFFNTCSVRQHAEDKIYSALGRLRSHKRRHPDTVLGVLGCMAQKDKELILRRAPHVDILCGTGQLAQLPELIAEVRRTGQRQLALSLDRKEASRAEVERSFESYDPLRDPSQRPSAFQAYVRVMIGCDKFCTYCIVPSVRGPEQSRPPGVIAAEVRQLAGEGCKEITLLGQTVNSYQFHHGDGRRERLSDLLARVHDTPGIERIKFITNFPRDMTDDLLEAVRDLPRVGPYLHAAGFKNSYNFKYSARPGTKADELFPDDVPEEVKKRRNNDLLAVQNAVSLADHRGRIGQTVEVLVEGLSKTALKHDAGSGPRQLTGRTLTDHIVVFEGNERLVGRTVVVRVEEATAFTLFGTVVTGEQVGVECDRAPEDMPRTEAKRRVSLPLV